MPAPAKRRLERVRLDVDARRAQLLELGITAFGAQPYDDVSIDDIARAAGISKGLLYHYFPTKRAFYTETIRAAAARLVHACDPSPSLEPRLQLHAGLDAYLSYVRAHAGAYATLMRSGVGADPDVAAVVDETRNAFVQLLTRGLTTSAETEGGADPAIFTTPFARLAMRGWIGFVEAVSLDWASALEAGDATPTQEEIRDLCASVLVERITSLFNEATAKR